MKILHVLLIMLVSLVLGYGLGRYLAPVKIEKQMVEVEKEVIKKDIVTVIKEIKRPDGTVETTSSTVDRSEVVKEIEKEIRVEVEAKKHDWLLRALVEARDFALPPNYGVGLERRILGPIFLGAYYVSTKTIGLSVGLEF